MSDWFLDDRLAGCRRLYIRAFEVTALIGVLPEEQGRPQPVRFDIDMWTPLAHTPSVRDSLADVVDYGFVLPDIRALLAQGQIGLLETLVDRVLDCLLAHPKIRAARVRAEKPVAYVDCAAAGVDVFRCRT